jgi:hypothetical protein
VTANFTDVSNATAFPSQNFRIEIRDNDRTHFFHTPYRHIAEFVVDSVNFYQNCITPKPTTTLGLLLNEGTKE